MTPGRSAWTLAAWGTVSWLVTVATYPFINDHFGRMSAARQIARYGELPFRDFLDPGYVLTELMSAGVQLLFGDNVLGEILLTSAFIAAGAVLVVLLARRVAPSRTSVVVVGVLVILAAPRPYDFDKILFYPLGILLCWRYAEQPDTRRLWVLAAATVVAGMFRYDNGLFMLAAGLVTAVAIHARKLKTAGRQIAVMMAAVVACAVPYLLFLQLDGGIANAADQMLTYARREGARTWLTDIPSPMPTDLRFVHHPDHVNVRWAPAADAERSRLESRYTLHDGIIRGNPDDRVWLYTIDNTSRDNLRALVDDPLVLDTHLIDRSTARLIREGSTFVRAYRQVPLIGHWSVTWTSEDAATLLYWVFLLVPVAALATVFLHQADTVDRARVFAAVAMAACVVGFILREPIVARMSGAAGPTIVLGAWLWGKVHRHWLARALAVVVIVTTAVVTGWNSTVVRLSENVPTLSSRLGAAVVAPPPPLFLPTSPLGAIVQYVRRCTRPDDRIFAGWFVPELFYFSQRGFAGGVAAMFGHHWSESAFQRRIITKLTSESVPVVILPNENRDFQETYVDVLKYFQAHYHAAGKTTFGFPSGPTYLVLTRNDRTPTGTDSISALPCFAAHEP